MKLFVGGRGGTRKRTCTADNSPRALPGGRWSRHPRTLNPYATPGHIRARQRELSENKADKETAN